MRKLTQQEYTDKISEYGIVNIEPYINARTRIKHICPVCKGVWNELPHNIISCGKRKCNKCSGYNDRLSQEEYEKRLGTIGIVVVDKYINCTTKIKHICPRCNQEWLVKPDDILYNGHRCCERCNCSLKESNLATVLKQICLHEDATTIVEADLGFRGPNGGISTYDICIESKKLVIECQSKYHDSKKDFDEHKRLFAINRGYRYIAVDNRDYTELDAIKLIFPHIIELPEYIKNGEYVGYNRIIDYKKIEELLDKNYTYNKVADELGITYSQVLNAVTSGKVKRRKGTKIRQLDPSSIVIATLKDGRKIETQLKDIKSGNQKLKITLACKGKGSGKDGHYYKGIKFEFKQ